MRFLAVFVVLAFAVPLLVMWWRGRRRNPEMALRTDRPSLKDPGGGIKGDAGGGWGY